MKIRKSEDLLKCVLPPVLELWDRCVCFARRKTAAAVYEDCRSFLFFLPFTKHSACIPPAAIVFGEAVDCPLAAKQRNRVSVRVLADTR